MLQYEIYKYIIMYVTSVYNSKSLGHELDVQ